MYTETYEFDKLLVSVSREACLSRMIDTDGPLVGGDDRLHGHTHTHTHTLTDWLTDWHRTVRSTAFSLRRRRRPAWPSLIEFVMAPCHVTSGTLGHVPARPDRHFRSATQQRAA